MISLLLTATLLVAGHDETARDFIESMKLPEARICEAVEKFTIEKGPIEACDDRSVRELRDGDCRTHYTIYNKGSKKICQCNKGTKHSEKLAAEDGAKDMKNVAYPCKSTCYRHMIRTIIKDSKKIKITYKDVRGDASEYLHESLQKYCAKRKK